MLSSRGAAGSVSGDVADSPPWPEPPEAASDPEPLLPRAEIPPRVSNAASRKVHTTLNAECGKAGGFPGRYAPVAMDSDVRIAVLRANRAAARNGCAQSIATKPA
jgi:hypothetical protein